jgi:hypothetical protein
VFLEESESSISNVGTLAALLDFLRAVRGPTDGLLAGPDTTQVAARFGPSQVLGALARGVWNSFSLTAFLDFNEEQCPMSGI